MKITKKTKCQKSFKDLRVDEWYVDSEGDIGIKMNCFGTYYNCMWFSENGAAHLHEMDEDAYVTPVEVELIITD